MGAASAWVPRAAKKSASSVPSLIISYLLLQGNGVERDAPVPEAGARAGAGRIDLERAVGAVGVLDVLAAEEHGVAVRDRGRVVAAPRRETDDRVLAEVVVRRLARLGD